MRRLFTLIFFSAVLNVSAQFQKTFSFDDSTYSTYIKIDSQTYHNNSWIVGTPNKALFNTANSIPNAILTDKQNPYPVNDTSVFIFRYKTIDEYPHDNTFFSFSFAYQLDIDSGEIARVEVSGDTGHTWIDMLKEDTTYDFMWFNKKPILHKTLNGWQSFGAIMTDWVYDHKGYPQTFTADTLLFRFTFISDSIQTNKNGWMIDDIIIRESFESVEDILNNALFTLYPNPPDGSFFIKQQTANYTNPAVTIYNLQGQVLQEIKNIPDNGKVNTSLPDGTYLLKYFSESGQKIDKFIVIH